MGCKLANPRGANLYDYWEEKVTRLIRKDMRALGADILVNLASHENAKRANRARPIRQNAGSTSAA